jgi:nitrite reductase (NADH) large subunit
LTRTSVWLEKLEGGIDYLRDVIIHDRLGICAELEKQIQFFVDTYQCEWKEVVNDPEKRRWFKQFVNTDETEPAIEFVQQRAQRRPADWTTHFVPVKELKVRSRKSADAPAPAPPVEWLLVGKVWEFPQDGGAAIKYGHVQIAVFNFASRGEWYACQNMCPHRREFVLSRGMIGDQNGTPKVACPVHKKTFALESGQCLSGESYSVQVFPVKIDGDDVYLKLPPTEVLDAALATDQTCNGSCYPAESVANRQKMALPTRKAKVLDPFAVDAFGNPK